MFPNGFDDTFEDGIPLFFAPAGVPKLGEPGDDDNGACGADPFDFATGGVTLAFDLSPNFIDGGAWALDVIPAGGAEFDFGACVF